MSSFAASSSGIHRAVLTRPNVSSRQRLRQATEASLPSSGRSIRPIITKVQRGIPQSSVTELAQVANAIDSETITTILAALLGVSAGIGVPVFFVMQEERDKERLEEIRELNRATLKATGEQMTEEEINDLRPSRYLDRREFKDDD